MLEVRDLSLQRGNRRIFDHLNLIVKAHELVVLTGQNGSGKSSLARIIMGIESTRQGRIIFQQQDITRLKLARRARLGLAYAFQQNVCFKGLNLFDLLNLAAHEKLESTQAARLLEQVGLDASYLQRELSDNLSGGERKRIEIASILAQKTAKLMIFDEPEAGIDLWSFAELVKLFQKLKKEQGKTLLIISHQTRVLEQADRIYLIDQQKLKQFKNYTEFSQAVRP